MRDPIKRLELARFLRDRRARVRPESIGLTTTVRRRVAGLRREEVATLAGVGATWYAMLEKGTAKGVSAATLDAVSRALSLTPDETAYVHSLADGTAPGHPSDVVDPLTRAALGAIEWMPAYVCTTQWIVLAWNRAMTRVWGIEPPGGAPFNIVSRSFLDERIRVLHGERFPEFARALVAMVRSGAGSRGDDPIYAMIHADLKNDPTFAAAWDSYDVAAPLGLINISITVPGIGAFGYQPLALPVPNQPGHRLVIQVPDDASAARLRGALTDPAFAGR